MDLKREKRKIEFVPKLCKLLEEHSGIVVIEMDELQSTQLNEIRKTLNGKAIIQMGNNVHVIAILINHLISY